MAPPFPEVEGVEHNFATVRGLRLHYAEAGAGDPLLLVHGWPQHWWMWRRYIAPLVEAGHRVICPDLRGHGWSDKPRASYRRDEMMRDLLALLDELGIERVRYAGHDWGGWVGMLAALHHPDRIERLVVMSLPHPWSSRRADPRQALSLTYMIPLATPLVGDVVIGRLRMPERMLRSGRRIGTFDDDELATYMQFLHEPGTVGAWTRVYRHFVLHELPQVAGGDFRQLRLTVPTLWVYGEHDPVVAHHDEGYRDFTDDMTLERVDGAGHFLPDELPDLVLERLRTFLG